MLFGLCLLASISGRLCFFLEPTPHKTESEAIVNGSGSLDWALRSRERQGDGRSKDWPSAQAGSRRQQYRATYCDSSTTHKGHRPTQPSKTITSQPLPLSCLGGNETSPLMEQATRISSLSKRNCLRPQAYSHTSPISHAAHPGTHQGNQILAGPPSDCGFVWIWLGPLDPPASRRIATLSGPAQVK